MAAALVPTKAATAASSLVDAGTLARPPELLHPVTD